MTTLRQTPACVVCPSIQSTLWGPGPRRVSYPVPFASLPWIRKQRASHWYNKTFIWPRSQGRDQVQLTWAHPFNRFKCPHPTPPTWDGSCVWGLYPKNLSWEITKAASVLLKSLGVVAAWGQVVPNVLQVLHISQNPIYARLQWTEVAPLTACPLFQLWHQRPQLTVDLGLGLEKLLLQ